MECCPTVFFCMAANAKGHLSFKDTIDLNELTGGELDEI